MSFQICPKCGYHGFADYFCPMCGAVIGDYIHQEDE